MAYTSGMSVQVSLPSAIDIYLRQWLKVASGDRVVLYQHTGSLSHSFTVFKCKTCGDNWHVGDNNFEGAQVPQTLKDWVTKHRHVCSKWKWFGSNTPHTGVCVTCGWPYGAHEESWMTKTPETPKTPTVNDPQDGIDAWEDEPEWVKKAKATKWVLLPVKGGDKAPIVKATSKPLPEFTGRKFRDVE